MSVTDLVLVAVAFIAGAQNALAGGGSFITFPALLFAGLDPRAANITSAIALFPGQLTTGLAGRSLVRGVMGLSVRALILISLAGGGVGAVLLLATPVALFTHLVPFLVLFATVVFAWGSFWRKARPEHAKPALSPRTAAVMQFFIAVYGGYFGGGIGILMLATLTAAGLVVRHAGATKNVLAGVCNAAAVLLFIWETKVDWHIVLLVGIAAIAGGQLGVYLLRRINETFLRLAITGIGVLLTIGLFIRASL
ncbi:MAG: transporter [Acidocella sp. 20-57-95]|nr:MAG: transporter [Acidocella sp. 20-57-95]OYV60437.1 MAG: transporter [Acidocella sp. 21-58-7]HQT64238.1 sulfite exporter TauE/SafE family protein [Acidocella sp.]HQU03741.1 sulfite exporter TauE/SafE family protein [Acidocella sp.]